ncbi:radial spoke head 10 homolog B [Sphaeramia orbicularis]|uniref:radial spoke head 10 homolog B n=1 Tax=Sphaeramia orbicularis TaxID=375764 RepID=UPI00118008B7|nr:radial spoke head 10 homolog B [Sphaeramia orbicularis]
MAEGQFSGELLIRCSGSEKNSAESDQVQTIRHPCDPGVPRNDAVYELPALSSLVIPAYEGETCEGHPHGQGVASFVGGHMYKGMFSRGCMDGHGVFTWTCGLKYEGEFVWNSLMGQGLYTWPDGSSYKGEVYYGIRHGTGTYKSATSVVYKGQWYQGKREGKGAVYYNQEKTSWYKGDWVMNNREGWGERRYPSGNLYSGEWKNNQRHGEGTMKWLKLGQQYHGTWYKGVRHGRGTHMWILRRQDGSQYSQSNQYTGDFFQGERHGQGTFHYAGGAIYEGEWKNNKKHGQGKFTFNNGKVFQGEFVDDQMIITSLSDDRTPITHEFLPLSGPGPDVALSTEYLLEKIPKTKHDVEQKQVELMVLRHNTELRSIYSFYSRLGHTQSPDNVFLLSHLQLWRLLRDCNVHHHGVTLTQINLFIREDASSTEVHSPFSTMLFRRLLSCLVVVSYHIYHRDMESSDEPILAACFSKLMTDCILPNAMNVKGFLFRHSDSTLEALKYMEKSWEIYQAYSRVNAAPRDDKTMTCRHLLWMFKDLHLFDNNLTAARLLEIITAESHDPSNQSSSLDLEITFLEFFEALLGCAEVKCQDDVHSPTKDSLETEAVEKTLPTLKSPSQTVTASADTPRLSTTYHTDSGHLEVVDNEAQPSG